MKRLLIDVPALIRSGVPVEQIDCEYLYHRKNEGVFSLLEIAEFATYCRQCKDAFCVAACPKEALERQENGTIKRYNMRCVGCKSCVLACPFGCIFPEVINYITSKCDHCLNQLQDKADYKPACVKTAPKGTLSMLEIDQENAEEHLYLVGDYMAVKSPGWRQKEGK